MKKSSGEPPVSRNAAPLCITGMHRSGTTMVTRILAACGLNLGGQDRLMPAMPDNPDGFFENIDLVQMNDRLLDAFNGGWDAPPELPLNWVESSLSQEMIPQGKELLAALSDEQEGPWGWKDPRTSLLLPFWKKLLPELKIILCVRNPLAVAQSLRKRGNSSLSFGLQLWQKYHEFLQSALASEAVLVSHYDAWFSNSQAELERILGFLGWDVPAAQRAESLKFIKYDYRHHLGGDLNQLLDRGGSQLIAVYQQLRLLAGPVYKESTEGRAICTVASTAVEKIEEGGTCRDCSRLKLENSLLQNQNKAISEKLREQLSRPAHYRQSTIIDFTLGGNASLYTREGWAKGQAQGTWSVGSSSRLQFELIEPASQMLRLTGQVRPMVAPGHERLDVQLLVNGREVADWSFDRAVLVDIEVEIPAELLSGATSLALELRVLNPCSPKSLGISADDRILGLLVHQLCLS